MKKYDINIEGEAFKVTIESVSGDTASVSVNGRQFNVAWKEEKEGMSKVVAPKTAHAPVSTPAVTAAKPSVSPSSAIKSPLPGVILEVKVNVGDKIEVGQVVAVIEAMKMENDIEAERGGIVKSINVNKGDSVLQDTPIITIE